MPLQAVLGREGKECKECVQFPEHNPNKYEGKEGLRTKHRDSKLRFSELLPVSVAFKTSHTALEADCPGNSGTKQEVPFTKSTLESHSLAITTGSV